MNLGQQSEYLAKFYPAMSVVSAKQTMKHLKLYLNTSAFL